MAENQYLEKVIKIRFPDDYDTMEKIRSIPERKHHGESNAWSAPLTIPNLTKLAGWGFVLDDHLLQYLRESKIKSSKVSSTPITLLKGELLPFQAEGVAMIEAMKGRVLLADEMGLGKTVQALAWLALHPELRPVVIVVPAFLKLNWQREARKWIKGVNVEILSGTTPYKTTGDILILNYDILSAWLKALQKKAPAVLIADESHYFKSSSAKRTKAIKKLGKGVNHIINISGTPITNKPVEIYNAVNMVNPNLFPNYIRFTEKYCGRKKDRYGWNVDGATNMKELNAILKSTVMIRRLKKNVLKDLPDKFYSYIPMEMDNREEYNRAEADFITYVRETRGDKAAKKAVRGEALVKIGGLKQLAVAGMLNQAVEYVKDFLESDQKLIIFGVHRATINKLMEAFPDISVKIDGTVNQKDRDAAVDKFQTDPNTKLFIGTMRAAGVGITLTTASNVLILELPWTPGELSQAIDRAHRIGQKEKVMIRFLFAADTILEKIAYKLDSKQQILDATLDGIDTDKESLLTYLINSYL